VGSEHSRKEPSGQLIFWLFGTLIGLRLAQRVASTSQYFTYESFKKFFTCLISILSAKYGPSSKKAEECFG
jgi:hypothetical protein